ncbi:ABC transporter ATP-binding protein [bacterium]|jgi:ABC-2 type transport system ATP-binding protein|nr:ABC transporter ATP-binding protein [Mariniblastus sp.]MDA7887263.1 ABC transporter ATP-binding protein [bacterium]MDA7924062.1 ABC transporter ATP-binding protein [Mariniblastus sp.]MDA7925926.1 ABC transporter ATP-binding protein [Mariniblastus sp.]MDB4386321.1 ABC transporter ATP-binding protein [bacterium]
MTSLISLKQITKSFKSIRALDGVDLEVQAGITGLLGPNGAGKSTLIKLLLGLVKPSSGTASFLGYDVMKQGRQIRNRIGYMPEDDCYISGLSGVNAVQFSGCLSGIPKTESLRRAHEILDFCDMKQERYRMVDTYSTGMRQKIKFASAIVHDPEFLILDEPTSGLDPEERETLLKRIRLLASKMGKSVLISTHILPDVQAICDDVVILSQGKVKLSESLATLTRTAEPSFCIRVLDNLDRLADALEKHDVEVSKNPDGTLTVASQSPELPETIWSAAYDAQVSIQSLIPARNSLEEVFLSTVTDPPENGGTT